METKNDTIIEEVLIIWYYMVELVGGNISRAHDSIDNGTEDGQRTAQNHQSMRESSS